MLYPVVYSYLTDLTIQKRCDQLLACGSANQHESKVIMMIVPACILSHIKNLVLVHILSTKKLSTDKLFIQKYFHNNTRFAPRLHQFWNLYQTPIQAPGNILQIVLFELNERIPDKDKHGKVDASINKASRALITSCNIAESILNNPHGINAITNVLSALESRVEGHEYLMNRILNEAKRAVNLDYDIEEMCSVQKKIQKGTEWRSDVRAIRDAYSHSQYVIRESNGDYEVAFDNNEGGYNFQKSFSRREFLLFYQDYDRLMAIQNTLFRAGLIYKLVDLQAQLDGIA